jgi:hypothetical protein
VSWNRGGIVRVLLLFAGMVSAASAQSVPPAVLHHLRIGIDSVTLREFHASPLWQRYFAAVDTVTLTTGASRVRRQLLIGRRSWLELVEGTGPASVELGLTTEDGAATARLVAAWRRAGVRFDSSVVMRPAAGRPAPWYTRWAVPRAAGAMVGIELNAWHPALFARLASTDSLPPEMADRSRALRSTFDPARHFSEVTQVTVAVPLEEIAALGVALRGGGVTVMDEGEGVVAVLEDGIRVRFIPAHERPGLRRLELYLTQAAPANPSYRFGPRSRMRFGPGRVAVWDFDLP